MQSLRQTTSPRSPTILCARQLLETSSLLTRYVRLHMRRHRQGLSIPQFRALYKVRTQPEASLSVVAEHLGASLPTASRIVAALVTKGFLTRGSSTADRRQVALSITPRGRAIVDAAQAGTQAHMESQLEQLNAGECEALRQAMTLLQSVLERANGTPVTQTLRRSGEPRARRRVLSAA